MKNIFKLFVACAFATLGFSACQQEEINYNEETATHTVTFIAESPETKTTVDISDDNTAIFAWTAADVNRFTVYENGTKATKASGSLSDGTMTVKATFEDSAVEVASYVAVVNKSNNEQIMSAEAYDEDADILVSKAVTAFDGESGVPLQFKREVAIAKMTLKGLDAGEVVNMVTVSSTAEIAGSYGVDGWASPAETSLEISSAFAMAGEGYSIVANEDGEAVVWFTCIPQDAATLTVNVEAADGDTYTKEFSKPITLTRGDVKAFGVAMAKGLKKEKVYSLVESAPVDWTGKYILVATNSDINYALDMNNATYDWGVCSAVSIENNSLSANSAGIVVIVEKGTTEGTYSIKSSDGNYLSASAKGKFNYSSTYKSSDNDFEFTINESTHIVTVAQASSTTSPKRNLRYNYNSGNGGFRWYEGTTGSSPKFYSYRGQKYILPSPEGISVNSETKMVSWNTVDGADSYVLTIGIEEYPCTSNSYDASAIADEYYDVAVVAVPSDTENYKNSAAATLPGAKFGTPTLTAPTLKEGAIDEFSVNATWAVDPRATAGYNCELYKGETKVGDSQTVNNGSVTFEGLDDGITYTVKVNAIAVEGAKAYAASAVATIDLTTKGTVTLSQIAEAGTYTVKNVIVYAVIGSTTAVIGDGTAYLYMYKPSHGLAVGDKFNVGGTVSLYNNVLQFNNPTISNKTTGSTPAYENPEEANEEYLTSYASATVTEYIHAKGTQSGRNITVGSKKLYLSATNTATDGKDVEVYGFVYGYNSNSSYAYFYATSIAEDPTVPKLSVTPTSKTWASTETDAAVFTVRTNTEGINDWSVSPTILDWATIAIDKDAGTITVTPNGANTTENARGATLTVSHSAGDLSKTITLTQKAAGSAASKQYTLTITKDDFISKSYADNNIDKTTKAVAEDGATMDVTWYSNQVMLSSGTMQWQKKTGYIYNKTDLGEIVSVTVNSTAGTYTTYYGTTQNPNSSTTVSGGYFTVKVGNVIGKTESVVIVFNK